MPIVALIFVIVAVMLGIALDLGVVFYKRRDLQKAADMAAIAGAQGLPDCTTVATLVTNSLTANLGATELGTATVSASCGQWAMASSGTSGTFTPDGALAAGAARDSVSVTISENVASLLMGTRNVGATAVAQKKGKSATFSVGSGLLALDTSKGLLGPLLTSIGVNPALYVGYGNQLVGATVTPSGLLQALGIPVSANVTAASLNSVAKIQTLTVGQLLSASLSALQSQGNAAQAYVGVLSNLVTLMGSSAVLNNHISLFGTATTPGVIADISSAGTTALNANVNVMDLISAAVVAGVLDPGNPLTSNALTVPVSLPAVTLYGRIIAPPSIAVGDVGAKATTAQVRLYAHINPNSIPAIGTILSAVGTSVDLPLIIEVAQSTGTLTALSCTPQRSATIAVNSGTVNLCVGVFANAASLTNSANSCISASDLKGRATIATVLGIPPAAGIQVKSQVMLSLLGNQSSLTFPANPPALPYTQSTSATVDVSSLVSALLGAILNDISVNTSASIGSQTASTVGNLLGAAGPGSTMGAIVSNVTTFLTNASTAVNGLVSGLGGTLGSLLTLNIGGVVTGLGNVVTGLVGTAGALLTGIGSALGGLVCNAVGIFNPTAGAQCQIPLNIGSTANAVNAVVGVVFEVLKQVFDTTLSPLLNNLLNTLGIKLGITDVTLMNINCNAGTVQLVY
ncbi:TadG family pilus assembly protein [Pandoraea terrae]